MLPRLLRYERSRCRPAEVDYPGLVSFVGHVACRAKRQTTSGAPVLHPYDKHEQSVRVREGGYGTTSCPDRLLQGNSELCSYAYGAYLLPTMEERRLFLRAFPAQEAMMEEHQTLGILFGFGCGRYRLPSAYHPWLFGHSIPALRVID